MVGQDKADKMQSFLSVLRNRIVFALITILIIFPLTILLLSSNNIEYYLNVIFYTQKIFLIASLFIFLSFITLKEKQIDYKMPDIDDTVAYIVISFVLIATLATLHTNFDTVLKMEILSIDRNIAWLGFGGFLADSFDLDRIFIDSNGIKKIIELESSPNAPLTLRLHTGWESPREFNSTVLLVINREYRLDLSNTYANLNNSEPSWIDVVIPAHALKAGENIVELKSYGPSNVFLTSQWVYHDGKTLRTDGSYYGEEALIYLRDSSNHPPSLFQLAFNYQTLIKLLAIGFLLLALFGKDTLMSVCSQYGGHLLILLILSILAVNGVLFIQSQWEHLSALTGRILSYSLGSFLTVYANFDNQEGPVIGVNNFYIRLYKSCSGIESIAVFITLFFVMIFFNWHAINKKLIPFLFILGIMGTFLVNVLRLACLIFLGAFVSEDLAVGAFHTNLGWIFMLVYFTCFNELTLIFARRKTNGS